MTVLALAVAVTAIVTLWNVVWGYADSARRFYAVRGTDIVVVRAGVSNRLTSSLRLEMLARVAAIPGVADVDCSLTEMVSLGQSHLVGIPLRGLSLNGWTLSQLEIVEGQTLQPENRDDVLLGNGLASALKKRAGQHLDIEEQQYKIAGIFQATNPFDSNSVVASLEAVQAVMERPDGISELQVRVDARSRDEVGLMQVCRQIEQLQDSAGRPLGLKAQRTQQFVDSATEASLGKAMAWSTTAIVLVLSLLGMLNTMLMSVFERTRELGLLRAIGWRRSRIMRMIVGESCLISVFAAFVGVVAAWLLLLLFSYWSKTSLLVPTGLSISAVAIGFAAAVLAGMAGSVYPAWYASGITPVEALRHE